MSDGGKQISSFTTSQSFTMPLGWQKNIIIWLFFNFNLNLFVVMDLYLVKASQ